MKHSIRWAGHGWALALAVLLACSPLTAPTAFADGAKAVYHADFADPRRFSAMLTSINNMLNFYESELMDADVRAVFVAHGIRFLTDDALSNTPFNEDAQLREVPENLKGRLMSLVQVRGLKLELCNITRAQIGLAQDKVYENVSLVPSGVVRIAKLQAQGFAYIKVE